MPKPRDSSPSMRFSPEFLDRLRSQVVLSQVVGRRVALKRHGREHTGLCPFHKEKSPSFTVNDDKGFYHCFGCNAHGDAIRFLTEHEGLPYPEAVERLAGEFGLPLPQMTHEQVQVAKRYGTLQDVMEAACVWFEGQLKAPSGKVAQDYLKGRGLTGKTAKHFRMGFSPNGRDALKTHMLAHGVTESQLVEVGLAIRPERGATYDRFRARVMFPITDRRGKVIAFGGRVIPSLVDESNREAPKYLNSPETPLFKKGEVLYAYEHARQMAHKTGTLLVTEGYMDVIALHQQGFANGVAPLGTAVTENHLRLMWQTVDEPILCLDGDAAGQRAMHRAAELSLPLLKPGKSLRFLVLPKGEDPDTLVRKEGAEAFSSRLEMAVPLSDALWEHYAADLKANATPEKKAALEHTLTGLSERIVDPVVKAHFREFFRKRIWPERKFTPKGKGVKGKAGNELPQGRSRDVEAFMKSGNRSQMRKREQALLRLVLQNPSLLQWGEVEEALGAFIFTDITTDSIRQLIMDVVVIDHTLPRAEVERLAQARSVAQNVAALYGQEKEEAVANEQRALQLWRLEVNGHSLIRMEAERKALEAEMSEQMDEESYGRLIALIKQIGDLQNQSSELQSQLDRTGN